MPMTIPDRLQNLAEARMLMEEVKMSLSKEEKIAAIDLDTTIAYIDKISKMFYESVTVTKKESA